MKFENQTDKTVGPFLVGGQSYTVESGGSCSIPNALGFAVGARGLPLVMVDAEVEVERRRAKTLAEAITMRLDGERPDVSALSNADVVVFSALGAEVAQMVEQAVEGERRHVAGLRSRVEELSRSLNTTTAQLDDATASVESYTTRIASLEADLAAAQELLASADKAHDEKSEKTSDKAAQKPVDKPADPPPDAPPADPKHKPKGK